MVVRKKYKILRHEDRTKLEQMSHMGVKVARIAEELGVNRATIYNEYRRCGATQDTYSAEMGQKAVKRDYK